MSNDFTSGQILAKEVFNLLKRQQESLLLQYNEIREFIENAEKKKEVASLWFPVYVDALRLSLEYAFDPLSVVSIGRIDPLPHQIEAFLEMVEKDPIRVLLADDVGLGKTIEVGLVLKELVLRGTVKSILIIVPPILAPQWLVEMKSKFGLEFKYLHKNFTEKDVLENNFVIVNLDTFKTDKRLQWFISRFWDVVVFDEAHKLTPRSKRFESAERISKQCRHLFLLSATPHDGKRKNFMRRLSLLDERFSTLSSDAELLGLLRSYMIRRIKRDVTDFEGRPLFPTRLKPTTVRVEMSESERKYYFLAEEYVRTYYLNPETLERYRNIIFILLVVLRRISSSLYSALVTLKRRRNKIAKRLEELGVDLSSMRLSEQARTNVHKGTTSITFDVGQSEISEEDLEELAEKVSEALFSYPNETSQVTLEDFLEEYDLADDREKELLEEIALEELKLEGVLALRDELEALDQLIKLGEELLSRGIDSKLKTLISQLKELRQHRSEDKIIIFTEFRDTLDYLKKALEDEGFKVTAIWGGLDVDEKERLKREFKEYSDILIGTEATGEGINLQFANIVINYELPWNPNRLDQRIGRVYRYGQTKPILINNFSSVFPVEDRILSKLYDKIETIRVDLGDTVIDVLGTMIPETKITEIILKAFLDEEGAEQEIVQLVEERTKLAEEITNRYLVAENINIQRLVKRGFRIDRVTLFDIERFVLSALKLFGASVVPFVRSSEELSEGTSDLSRENEKQVKSSTYLTQTYELELFDFKKRLAQLDLDGKTRDYVLSLPQKTRISFSTESEDEGLEFIAMGHPLVDCLINAVLSETRSAFLLDTSSSGQVSVLLPVIHAYVLKDKENPVPLIDRVFDFSFVKYAKIGLLKMALPSEHSNKNNFFLQFISPLRTWDFVSFADVQVTDDEASVFTELVSLHEKGVFDSVHRGIVGSSWDKMVQESFNSSDDLFVELLERYKQRKEQAIMYLYESKLEKIGREIEMNRHNDYLLPVLERDYQKIQREYNTAIQELEYEADPQNYEEVIIYPLGFGFLSSLSKARFKQLLETSKSAHASLVWNPLSEVVPSEIVDLIDFEKGINIRHMIDRAGMDAVMEYERQQGRIPKDVSDRIVGFDVESRSETIIKDVGEIREDVRFIEVKSFKTFGDIRLTTNEWRVAQMYPNNYYLYVVLYALDPAKREIIVRENPAETLRRYAIIEPVIDYRIVIPAHVIKNNY